MQQRHSSDGCRWSKVENICLFLKIIFYERGVVREPLNLNLYGELQGLFELMGAPFLEYNFPNLYLFRHKYRYSYDRENKIVRGVAQDGMPYFIPLVYPIDIEAVTKLLTEEGGVLFPLPDEWIGAFPEDKFIKSFLEEECDYFFRRESLSDLAGRKRATRRNLLYRFENDHPFLEVVSLEEADLPMAQSLLEKWATTHQGNDKKSCQEALSLMEELDLEGLLISEGKEPLAFAIFSPLNDDTLLLHFAKSLPRYKGGHVFLIQRVAKATSYAWIDIEQDLGIKGLKQEKHAFGPDLIKRKWRIRLKRIKKS
jgi:hypothetical protein